VTAVRAAPQPLAGPPSFKETNGPNSGQVIMRGKPVAKAVGYTARFAPVGALHKKSVRWTFPAFAGAVAQREMEQHSPPFSRRGARGIKSLEAEGGVVSNERRSAPYSLMEFTNRPVCAAKERDHFVCGAATPPWKGAVAQRTRNDQRKK
jgi:hypothetical protein